MVKFLYFSSAVKRGASSLPDNMQPAIRSCEPTEAQPISSSPLRSQSRSELKLLRCGYIIEPHLSRLHVHRSPKWHAALLDSACLTANTKDADFANLIRLHKH